MFKAFLIDPVAQAITEVEFNGDYREIYKLIDASLFTTVAITEDDAIFVDDEGLLQDGQRFFMVEGYPQPLAGHGLVLGCDDEGETVAPRISLSELKRRISWARPDLRLAGFEPVSGTVDTPFGPAEAFGHRPVFTTEPEQE